jgi:carbon storage regulator
MLVLRRRAGESVLIGDEIEVELLAVTQQGAKIGIRAPKETIVLRKELKITQEQNTRAAAGPSVQGLEQAIQKLRPQTQESILLPDKQLEH